MFNFFIMRGLLWLYVCVHAWLWFSQSIHWSMALFFFILSQFYAFLWPLRLKTRQGFIILAAAPLFFILLRLILFVLDVLALSRPLLLIQFDLAFKPAVAPFGLLVLFTYVCRRSAGFRQYEFLTRASFLMLAFWPMGGFQLFFYPHLSLFILSFSAYLLGEAFLLALQQNAAWPFKCGARLLAKTFIVCLPLLALITPALFLLSSARMTRYTAGLLKPTITGYDFSDTISLDTEISLGDELLLFLKLDKPLHGKALFKRYTLSGYHPSRGFFPLDPYKDLETMPLRPVEVAGPQYIGRQKTEQEFYFINLDAEALVAEYFARRIIPYKIWPNASFKRVYKAESETLDGWPEAIYTARSYELSVQEKAVYLDYGDDEVLHALAIEAAGQATTPFMQALALENYLKNNYLYSLRPGISANGNQLHHFLFESRQGYCSYFAFSMALMARSLGLPARVATGFWAGEDLEFMGYYQIKSAQAHAWVEIYFDRIGWVEFDPTSDRLAADELALGQPDDPERIYQLLNEIIQNKDLLEAQAQSEQLALHNAPSKSTAAFAWRKNLWKFLLFMPAVYVTALILKKRGLTPKRADGWRLQARKQHRVFAFKEARLNRNSNATRWNLLERYPEYGALYRKALFAPDFSQADFEALNRCAAAVSANWKKLPPLKRLALWLSPAWFAVRRLKR